MHRNLKNVKISHTNANMFKDFSANTLYVKHVPDFLQPSQKQTNLKIHSLTKSFFRLNIFAIYFPLKTHLFHHPGVPFLIRKFSLYLKKVDVLS